MINEELKLYSLSEASRILGIGTRALRSLIADGRIAIHTIAKRQKISYKDLTTFIESSRCMVVTTPAIEKNNPSHLIISNDLNTILQSIIQEKQNGLNLQTE